jgi:hypothetical protein
MSKVMVAVVAAVAIFVGLCIQDSPGLWSMEAGIKPHTGCYTNDRHDLNNQWCLWDGEHMHDGQGDKHDHSGWFDRGRNWHRRSHAVIHALCERRCFS